jgi:hypothetical protein
MVYNRPAIVFDAKASLQQDVASLKPTVRKLNQIIYLIAIYNFQLFLSSQVSYCKGFAQSVSRQWLGKHGQRATMEDVSQWTNVIARC